MIKSVVISTVHTSAPWKAVAKRIDSRLQGYLTTRFAYKNHQVSSVQLITEYSSPALTWVTLHRSSAKQGVSDVKTSGAAHQLTSIQCIGDASVEQGSVVTKRIALKYVAWENSDSEAVPKKVHHKLNINIIIRHLMTARRVPVIVRFASPQGPSHMLFGKQTGRNEVSCGFFPPC